MWTPAVPWPLEEGMSCLGRCYRSPACSGRALLKTGCRYGRDADVEDARKKSAGASRPCPTLRDTERSGCQNAHGRSFSGSTTYLYESRYRPNPTCTVLVCHRSGANARTNTPGSVFLHTSWQAAVSAARRCLGRASHTANSSGRCPLLGRKAEHRSVVVKPGSQGRIV